ARQAGRGVLFAAAHLGNWELSAFAHALLAEPMYTVVRPLDNPFLDRLVEGRRGLSGNLPMFKREFARTILKALDNNQAVGILLANLGEIIRRYPDQWLWIHRRWKTRPPGAPALYD